MFQSRESVKGVSCFLFASHRSLLLGEACIDLVDVAKKTLDEAFGDLTVTAVWKDDAWLGLPPRAILHLLNSPKLAAPSENTVFAAFERWLTDSAFSQFEKRSTALEAIQTGAQQLPRLRLFS